MAKNGVFGFLCGLTVVAGAALGLDPPLVAQDVNRFEKEVTAIEARDRANPPPRNGIIFVGSSSIRLWNLKKSFPELDVINRGFGGSKMSDAVFFAERLVLKHQPRMIVVYSGDNDIAANVAPEKVAADFEAFVKQVRTRLPKTGILFLAIKQSPSRLKFVEQQKMANSLIEAICQRSDNVKFVDVVTPMLGPDGKPRRELFRPDMLHLNDKGYELWTSLLKPHLTPTPGFKQIRIAGIVLKWIRGDKEANFARAETLIRQAAKNGAELVSTTECFLDGYAIADKTIPLATYRALGEPIPGGAYFQRLAALAKELHIHLVAGMLEADGDLRFNTAVLLGPEGQLIGKYRKQKLGHESVRNVPGKASPVFETSLGRIGLMICADRTESSIVKCFCTAGADWMVCPSGGMFGPKTNDPIVQARSRENGIPIVFVHPAEFLVTGPDGSILRRTLLGDRLLIKSEQRGSPADLNRVEYFELAAPREE